MNKRYVIEGYQPRAADSTAKIGSTGRRIMEPDPRKRSPDGPPASVPLPKTTSSVHVPKK